MSGRVVLVGAGPGDPDLLTVRAVREIGRAEVLLYDALIPREIIDLAPSGCDRIDVGKRGDGTRGVGQEEIAALLCGIARKGRRVVRLKGGDPFVFGRGGEEASALVEAGIPFDVVPGVSAALAAPACAGIPVTDRRHCSAFTVVTGHLGGRAIRDRAGGWSRLARGSETLVVLMGTRWLGEIASGLIAGGRDPETPVAVIENGTRPEQRVVEAPLASIAERVREAQLGPPTTIVIGDVVRLRASLAPRPLRGWRVLVLRAEAQRAELVARLHEAGAEPLCVPLLEIAPEEPAEALGRALCAAADGADWWLFTSANAVEVAAPRLPEALRARAAPGAPGPPRVACMGEATAARARAHGLRVDVLPEGSGPEPFVAALAGAGTLAGRRLFLPRSDAADDAIPDRLRALGAQPECVVAYRNRLPAEAAAALAGALEPPPHAVLLTSASSVRRLAELLEPGGLVRLSERVLCVCIGSRTAEALAATGVSRSWTAAEASSAGLVAVLTRYHGRHGLP